MVAIIKRRKRMLVAVNEKGMRIGQDHPRAKLTDHEVDLIRDLFDGGMSVSEISRKFEIPKSYAWDICHYNVRCQTPEKYKEVEVEVYECSDTERNKA